MMIKKFLKITKISLFFISFSFFISCQSSSFIPGQKNIQINNLYIEYFKIADSYYKLQDYTSAAEYYKKAMNSKEIYWDAYYKLAKTYAASTNWDQALFMFVKLQERDPENSGLKASLAYLYSMKGDFIKAKEIYEELLQTEEVNEKYLENYIAILLQNESIYLENQSEVELKIETLKQFFPENKNIEIFNKKITEYTKVTD